jgi:hypothetical protein
MTRGKYDPLAPNRGRARHAAYGSDHPRDTFKSRRGEAHDELGRRLRAEGTHVVGDHLPGYEFPDDLAYPSVLAPHQGIARAAALLAACIGSGPDGPPAAGVEAGREPMHDAPAERPLEYRRAAPPRGGPA